MKTKLTPHYIDLVYNAALKSFWRKGALAKFLRGCAVSEKFLGTWTEGESKRDFLDRLFAALPKTDEGRSALVRMARFLVEQRSFPDLENWEDSSQKLDEARKAVQQLLNLSLQQDKEVASEKDQARARTDYLKRQEDVGVARQNLAKLEVRLNSLCTRLGEQKAGYEFQDWFFDLVEFFEIPLRRPYVHEGRQIDGSITLSGTTYLVELKFSAQQAPATDVDIFCRKVSSKADNTMGILVSVSGFSSVALKEASGERTPLLLLDHGHVFMILRGQMSLGDVIERVRRHASQTGEAYLQVGEFSG